MPTSKARADTPGDWLVYILCAVVAAWVALTVNALLLADYATSRFWETWFAPDGRAIHWAPVVGVGLITGIVIGVVIGLVFPRQALKVAAVAAILQFVAGVASGGITSSVVLAASLIVGALPSRGAR